MEPESAQYNIPVVLRLKGALDKAALKTALNQIIVRHEVLRTVFRMETSGEARQEIVSKLELAIEELDFSLKAYPELTENEREQHLKEALHQEIHQSFDLSQGPLLRASLYVFSLSPIEEHIFLLNVHHSVADGWSMGILARELGEAYTSYVEHRDLNWEPLEIQYADFSVWQRDYLKEEGEVYQRQMAYWQAQLADVPSLLELPTDRARPAVFNPAGGRVKFVLPQDITKKNQTAESRN